MICICSLLTMLVLISLNKPSWKLPCILIELGQTLLDRISKKNAQTRNRTGGPTMATLDFTTKPFALERNAPRRGIEPRSTMRQTVILATKLSRTLLTLIRILIYISYLEKSAIISQRNVRLKIIHVQGGTISKEFCKFFGYLVICNIFLLTSNLLKFGKNENYSNK